MKIICISDTHMRHEGLIIPEGDMIIHAGDFTEEGWKSEANRFIEWFAGLKIKYKILIQGNHEVHISKKADQKEWFKLKISETNINYLENSSINIEGINIYGSPYTLEFFPEYWAWQLRKDLAKDCWDLIPDDTDILVTHSPPRYILDRGFGCKDLHTKVFHIRPKYHIFGHAHVGGQYEAEGIKFINAAMCGDRNKLVNQPIIFDYE